MLNITICPNCGSRKLKTVQRDLVRTTGGQRYIVPSLEFHECPNCGEKLFGPDAMQKIQSFSPAYASGRDKDHQRAKVGARR
jgi:YgiT-type zinc finger domain-containing protein